jgi:hypothetical protein
MKQYIYSLSLFLALILLAACGGQASTSQTGTCAPQYITVSPNELPPPTPSSANQPVVMKIGGKSIAVDKVVEGPLCNDTWSGTVYVTCNIQVYPWEKSPNFLQSCNLKIEPDTVVYVAYHRDKAYYNGCSCHTGEHTKP